MVSVIRGDDDFDSGVESTPSTTLGDVGTYAWMGRPSTGTISSGSTYSGSSLRYAGSASTNTFNDNTAMHIGGSAASGTWRAMGNAGISSRYCATLLVRIS